MARKKKDDKNKVVRYNFSVQPSLFTWISAQEKKSTYIQRLVAQDILGLTFEEFVNNIYNSELAIANRNHPQDSLEQEYLRAAKWMVDGQLISITVQDDCMYLVVKWRISGALTSLVMDNNTDGFKSVLYDAEIADVPDSTPSEDFYPDNAKAQMIIRWLNVSNMLDNSESVEIL